MIKKFLQLGFLVILFSTFTFIFTSCEKDNFNSNEKFNHEFTDYEFTDDELHGHFANFINENNFLDKKLSIKTEDVCGDTLELWYAQDFPYGIVTITNDDDNLYIKYEVYPELAEYGWTLLQTYLFIGDYTNLPLLTTGTVDWKQTDIEYCETGTNVFTRTISRESLTECFGIATKVKLLNPSGGQNPNPRALLLNDGNKGSYPWHENYEYCFGNCITTYDDPCDDPGTGTQGYWHKVSHWEDWGITEISIGEFTYTAAEATELIKKPGKGDKSYDMFAQLVAAKLNVLIGNCDWCISDIIDNADKWMENHPVGSQIPADSGYWDDASNWHYLLDEYNNGRLECASHRG